MLYLFDKNENLIHELSSTSLSSIHQIEELNKLMVLEFGVYLSHIHLMEDIEYVAHKDFENPEKIQMYRVLSSEADSNSVNYQAIHILFDELKSYGYIRDKRPTRVKASSALAEAIKGTKWQMGKVDDSDLLSVNFYDCTRLEALSKILTNWQMDLDFYLTFKGSKITGRYINLYKPRGEDTGERFVYGSNAIEVVKELDKSEVYTRIIPRGKGEEILDKYGKPTHEYGRRINIDDIVWSKSKGDPIDKPKGQEYIESVEMTKKFGFPDGEPRTKVQIFEDIEKPEDLIKAGYDFLVKASRPLVQFKTKVYKKSRTNVGDVVRIIRKDLSIYYRTRIYKANRDLLAGNVEVEFGDKLITSQAERDKKLSDSLGTLQDRLIETEAEIRSSFVDKVTEELTNAMFNRDGYNYEFKAGNKYNLPAGYYSFDREIDDNPQRVIYVGAGTLAIADSKKSNGDWNFRTFGTGKGFTADLLVAGIIIGGKVRWNLEDGTFLIGNSPTDYNLYWDGSTLHLRNVDIDLENNRTIQDLKEKQNLTDKEIEKRKQEILDAEKSLELAKSEIDNVNLDISNTVNALNEAKEKINSDIGSLNDTLDRNRLDLNASISSLDSKVDRNKNDLNTSIGNLDNKVDQNKKDLNTSISSLDSKVDQNKLDTNSSINTLDDKVNKNKSDQEFKNKVIDEKLLDINSRFTVTDDKIESSVSSITQTVEERIRVNKSEIEKYVDDKDLLLSNEINDKELALSNEIDDKDKELRKYITQNYSTNTQTDQKISQEIGSLKTQVNDDIGSLSKDITQAKSLIEQTDNRITTSIESITKGVDARIGSSIEHTDAEIGSLKDYISKNYSTITQTDSAIKVQIRSVETDLSNVKGDLNKLSTDVFITKFGLESKVSDNEIISKINQSPEQIKIDARKIDLTGDVSLRGDFTTYNSSDDVGIEMNYNKITWSDNKWAGKKFGSIMVSTNKYDSNEFSLNIGHYKTGQTILTYYDGNDWIRYATFDRWNYTGDGGKVHPICFYEGIRLKGETRVDDVIHFEKMRLKEYSNGIAIENYDGNGLFIKTDGTVCISRGGTIREVAAK